MWGNNQDFSTRTRQSLPQPKAEFLIKASSPHHNQSPIARAKMKMLRKIIGTFEGSRLENLSLSWVVGCAESSSAHLKGVGMHEGGDCFHS